MKISEPKLIKLRSGSYVRGPVWFSDIAFREIVILNPDIKQYQRTAFLMPKGIRSMVRVFDRIYIPEEI